MNSSGIFRFTDGLFKWLFDYLPFIIDSTVRRMDRVLFRTDCSGDGWLRKIQPQGHSIILPVLFLGMMYFVVSGPTYHMWFNLPGFFTAFALCFVSLLVAVSWSNSWPRHACLIQWVVLITTVGIIISLIDTNEVNGIKVAARESDDKLYGHAYLLLAPLIMTILLMPWLGLKWLFNSIDTEQTRSKFQKCLESIELFEDRGDTDKFTWDRVGNAFMLALFYNPVLLLLPPSVLIMFTPERHELTRNFWIGFAISVLLLMYGRLRERWHMMMQLVERATATGVPLAISVVVILAALGRWADYSYISIFLDGTRLTIWGYLLAFYVFAWIYEYWINRFLNEKLLCLFHSDVKRQNSSIDYRFNGKNVLPSSEDVFQHKRDRVLQIHGGSRFMVQSKDSNTWFHSYTRGALLSRLLSITTGQQDFIDNKKLLNTLERKIRIYFFSLNLLFIASVYVFIQWQTNRGVAPIYDASPNFETNTAACDSLTGEEQNFRLDCALWNFSSRSDVNNNNAILFAASGGGTRAALHTASVLYGLQQQGLAENVLLMSGVSGGGVASAYFSEHSDALIHEDPSDSCSEDLSEFETLDDDALKNHVAWHCYFGAMSHHYIKNVVEGMAEIRILQEDSNGVLLKESFEQHFARLVKSSATEPLTFATLQHHGLILNSSITGHRYQESEELRGLYGRNEKDVEEDKKDPHYFTIFQGGRMAFTNLANSGSINFPEYADEDLVLKYRAFNFQEMNLTTAAAMTANFPPVFSDARVCLSKNCEKSFADMSADYFVTDGGATHNQGLISLLAATEAAVTALKCEGATRTLPRLHVVVAEASFANFDYSEGSRGLGAALSAGYGLGNGVVGQLFEKIKNQYNQKLIECGAATEDELSRNPSIQVHMVSLPRFFRSRGGMGTHWMMPTNIHIIPPHAIGADDAKELQLSREDLSHYFANIYSRNTYMCTAADIEKVEKDKLSESYPQLCKILQDKGYIPKASEPAPCSRWLQIRDALVGGDVCQLPDRTSL